MQDRVYLTVEYTWVTTCPNCFREYAWTSTVCPGCCYVLSDTERRTIRQNGRWVEKPVAYPSDFTDRTAIRNKVLTDVVDERVRQMDLFGNDNHGHGVWLALLGRKVGSISDCVLNYKVNRDKGFDGTPTDLVKEITQLMAVLSAWREQIGIQKRGG